MLYPFAPMVVGARHVLPEFGCKVRRRIVQNRAANAIVRKPLRRRLRPLTSLHRRPAYTGQAILAEKIV